ncbi:hypothetical protein QBC37DRAFT_98373 [Rhypophila decipiens]|uniref:DUF7730 domain-containing protein n=1 Tax=Rhypophila decipiens TaxID=261697 RepID=A0AAN7B9Z9_9PEZI|nr:hypothetical protein QBC37DRAFT_98373 [Rhypophila decipiens]
MATHFRFLDLPAEIRLEIYRHVLITRTKDGSLPITKLQPRHLRKPICTHTPRTSILSSCRLIYHEAVPILYQQTVFSFGLEVEVLDFFHEVGRHNAKHIRHFKMEISFTAINPPLDPRGRLNLDIVRCIGNYCPNLREVEVGWNDYHHYLCCRPALVECAEYFRLLVTRFKNAFPNLKKISSPEMRARGRQFMYWRDRFIPNSRVEGWWDNGCDLLEANGWDLSKKVR